MKIVFFDRDGTLNIDTGYVTRPELMQIYPGAGNLIASLKKAGCAVVVVTNQSAVSRGMCSREDVDGTNEEFVRQLLQENPEAKIDAILVCPHSPEDDCDCRKPGIGSLKSLPTQWRYDPAHCWVVGDKLSDLKFGETLGIPYEQRILVLTGKGLAMSKQLKEDGVSVVIAKSLAEVSELLLPVIKRR